MVARDVAAMEASLLAAADADIRLPLFERFFAATGCQRCTDLGRHAGAECVARQLINKIHDHSPKAP